MEVEIISKKDNKLLERKEVNAVISFDAATPTRKEIREAVGTKLGLNPELTVLNSVVNEFGSKRIRVIAHSYTDMKKLMDTEPEYVRKRDGIGAEEKKEEKPAEAPAEKKEAPKEEKKEEKPKEEPKKEEPKKEEKPKEEPKEEKPKEEPKKEEKKEEAKEEKKGE